MGETQVSGDSSTRINSVNRVTLAVGGPKSCSVGQGLSKILGTLEAGVAPGEADTRWVGLSQLLGSLLSRLFWGLAYVHCWNGEAALVSGRALDILSICLYCQIMIQDSEAPSRPPRPRVLKLRGG